MSILNQKQSLFLACGISLFLLNSYAVGMNWGEVGVSLLLCATLVSFIWYYRKKIVSGINEIITVISIRPTLLYLALLALNVLYTTLLQGSSVLNCFLVCFSGLVHIVNFHSHENYHQGAVVTLVVCLVIQIMAILLYTTLTTMIAILVINYTALVLLANQFSYEQNISSNRIYILLTHGVLSTLLLLHSYSLAHIFVEAIMVIEQDTLGWKTLLSTRHPVGAILLTIGLVFAFFYKGRYQIKNRPSAVFTLICLWHLLFSQWSVVSTLLFTVFVCYLLLEKQYYSIEDLIEMDIVSEALEREVLKEFADSVKNVEDLNLLQAYIFEHPTFYAWHLYLHLAWCFMDNENYQKVVRIAEICLGVNEFEILFPEPEFILPE